MSASTAVARGRALAESLMVDACTIQHPTGETTGPGGVITTTYGPTFYSGKCRLQTQVVTRPGEDVGQAYIVLEHRVLQLPITVVGLKEGDQVTVTASALDPDLVGRKYVVHDVKQKTHLTKRLVNVLERTS